jgi:hypothetical protein
VNFQGVLRGVPTLVDQEPTLLKSEDA